MSQSPQPTSSPGVKPGNTVFPCVIGCSDVDRFQSCDLGRGETGEFFFAFAEEDLRIEAALGGVVDDAVFHAVEGVAGFERGFLKCGQLHAREVGARIELASLDDVDRSSKHAGPAIGGGAGKDAVVIVGKALGLHESFAASIGAGIEVGFLIVLAVEGSDNFSGAKASEVNGAPAEVFDFFGVLPRPACIGSFGLVTGIGTCNRKVALQIVCELIVADGAGKASVARAEEASIPILFGQPELKTNGGIGSRADDAGDTAKRRQSSYRRVRRGSRNGSAGGDGFR